MNENPATDEALAPASDNALRPRRGWRPSLRLIIVLSVLCGVALGLYFAGHEAIAWVKATIEHTRTPATLITLSVVYALLLAIPGVPGLEVGVVIIALFQELGIFVMWGCTVVGLNIAFLLGRRLPRARLEQLLKPKDLDESKLPDFVLGETDTITLVLERNAVGRWLLRRTGRPGGWRRYLLIGALLNMPGNFIIGGGGGIGMFAGTSHDLNWAPFLLTTVIAAAIIPTLALTGFVTLT